MKSRIFLKKKNNVMKKVTPKIYISSLQKLWLLKAKLNHWKVETALLFENGKYSISNSLIEGLLKPLREMNTSR